VLLERKGTEAAYVTQDGEARCCSSLQIVKNDNFRSIGEENMIFLKEGNSLGQLCFAPMAMCCGGFETAYNTQKFVRIK
jgi:hypothetical protein